MLSVGLTGSSTCWNESSGFLEGAHTRRLPSSPTICTTSPSLHEYRPLVWLVVVNFACPTISSIPRYCTISTSRYPSHQESPFIIYLQCFRPRPLCLDAPESGCLGRLVLLRQPGEFRDLRRGDGRPWFRVTLWFSQEFSYLPRS